MDYVDLLMVCCIGWIVMQFPREVLQKYPRFVRLHLAVPFIRSWRRLVQPADLPVL